jgi:hypothetical protein
LDLSNHLFVQDRGSSPRRGIPFCFLVVPPVARRVIFASAVLAFWLELQLRRLRGVALVWNFKPHRTEVGVFMRQRVQPAVVIRLSSRRHLLYAVSNLSYQLAHRLIPYLSSWLLPTGKRGEFQRYAVRKAPASNPLWGPFMLLTVAPSVSTAPFGSKILSTRVSGTSIE